jgi:phage tail-like protein
MAGEKQDNVWPLPKFYFSVDLGDLKNVAFQEVSGMDKEVQPLEYRHSNSKLFSPIKMPGMVKFGNVTMKRGVFVKDNTFWDWMNETKMNVIPRREVIIRLLDEEGKKTMQWTLRNAFPTKISSTDLKSEGSEVAIDSIEIAYEELEISNE